MRKKKHMTYLHLKNKEIIALVFIFDNIDKMGEASRTQNFQKLTQEKTENLNILLMYIKVEFIILKYKNTTL